MVTVIDYAKRTSQAGKDFFSLILQGDPEIVRSIDTKKAYITAHKCSIPSTFSELMCKRMIGKNLPGRIVRIDLNEPYEYTIPETQEKIMLSHTWEYMEQPTVEDAVFATQDY